MGRGEDRESHNVFGAVRKRVSRVLLIGIASLTLILGVWGFLEYDAQSSSPRSISHSVYQTLQLFVLETGSVAPPMPWQLNVARYLAVAVAAWALVTATTLVFRAQVEELRLKLWRGHVVICGLGRKGYQLATELAASGKRVAAIERDETNPYVALARRNGVLVVIGDAAHRQSLVRARAANAGQVIATCRDDSTNIDIAMLVERLAARGDDSIRAGARCAVHVADLALCGLLHHLPVFSGTSGRFEISVFNCYENAARLVLSDFPPDAKLRGPGDPRTVHLIVVGLGQLGKSLVLHAARTGHYANGRKISITVVDRGAEGRERFLRERFPQLHQVCDVAFIQDDIDHPGVLGRLAELAADQNRVTSVYLCLDDDSRSLARGLAAYEVFSEYGVPVFVRMDPIWSDDVLHGIGGTASTAKSAVQGFGMAAEACTRAVVLDEQLDRMAKAVHEAYVQRRMKEGVSRSDPSVRPWPALEPTLKNSCRHQADHIPVKLRAVKCRSGAAATVGTTPATLLDDEVEMLAKMEHARWNAERWLDGWRPGPRDPVEKTTPYLVDYDALDERIKEYDREAVRNMPRILALVGQAIYRIEEERPVPAATREPDGPHSP